MPAATRPPSPQRARAERALCACLVLLVQLAGALGRAGEELPSAVPSPTPEQPLTDAVDLIVKKVEEEREAACQKAREAGLPCFPVAVEKSARAALDEALTRLRKEMKPYPGNPGQSPLDLNRPRELRPPVGGVSFDPVCAVKALMKAVKGRNLTYYVYRVRDRLGEHVEMRDRPLDPQAYAHVAPFETELVGKYTGECEALAAHNKAQRELREQERQRRRQEELEREAQREREGETVAR